MQRRTVLIPLSVVALMAAMLVASNSVLDTPLSSPEGSEPVKYVREQVFSNPGIAGMRRFGSACSSCHGDRGEGTSQGPSLLDKDYARDFRNSEQFHSSAGQSISAHRDLLADLELEGKEGFNNLEFMGKFLREARRQDMIERQQEQPY